MSECQRFRPLAGSGPLRVNMFAGAQWAVITEQACLQTPGLGPRRAAVLWVRCGRTPSNRRPEQSQTPQFVGQRVG